MKTDNNQTKENVMSGIGDMSKEEAEALEASGAPLIAQQQADFAESQKSSGGEPEVHGDMEAVGFAATTTITSPGGPWHDLPPEAANDPTSPYWDENCRWSCVQGSVFACTFDGTTNIGEHAENVRGYGIPTEEGQGYMRSISTLEWFDQITKCIERGNEIVYNGLNVGYTKAG